jgi:hypothetical protein
MDYFHTGRALRRKLPDVLQIGVVGDFCPSNPAMRGLLKSTSPVEARHALVLSIARDIDDESTSVEVLKEWRRCILSTVACLTKYDTDRELFADAWHTREIVRAASQLVSYSPVPTISAV